MKKQIEKFQVSGAVYSYDMADTEHEAIRLACEGEESEWDDLTDSVCVYKVTLEVLENGQYKEIHREAI